MERPLISESLAQVTFDDAAIYFSEEQWQNLEAFQKKIYKELIKEIYETMLALGCRIPKPEVVSQIERGEEPCIDACKKPKHQESQPEGAPDGNKDSEPVIKVERESPVASTPVAPSEISSSQERSAAQCTRCGMYCNNQCRMGFQWNAQGMHPGSYLDGNQGKPYMTPPSTYFNGNPISPGFVSRGEGMSHPTSPMATYGNVGMVQLSPHYPGPGYRNATDPSSPFPLPERPGNPVLGFEQMPMGPPSSHVDLENRNRNPHVRDAMFHDRRNPLPPCPSCGAFCNNQCGMNMHWEQRRLHHPIPGPIDGAQGHRYTSPPLPYFSGVANCSSFSNIRPPVRHGTPPVNVQGNSGMIQISSPYQGYRSPGEAKSPNIFPNKPEHSAGNGFHGSNVSTSSPHGANQGVQYGTIPANSIGNHRKSQSMSPLAAIETMPVFAANNSLGTVGDQRNRPLPQTVTSSDNSRDRNVMPSYGRQQQQYCINGGKITRVQPATSAIGNTGQLKTGEAAGNKTCLASDGGDAASKKTLPSSSTFLSQGVEQVIVNESHATKRPASQTTSESGLPAKRASPPVIIVDCNEKRTMAPRTTGNDQGPVFMLLPTTNKSGLPSAPVVVGGSHDIKKTPPPEMKENKHQTLPITISNIRSAATPEMKENRRQTPPITISNIRSAATPEMKENKRQTPPITISNIRSGATPEMKENKRQTPPITISNIRSAATPEMKENKRRTPPITITNVRSAGIPEMKENKRQTPPITISNVRSAGILDMKENKRLTPPITISNVRSTGIPEVKESKRQTPPITISNIRSAGIFVAPTSRGPREIKDSNAIIIIDDRDGEGVVPPRTSLASSSNNEVKASKPVTPPVTNPKSNMEPPSTTNKTIQPQSGQQGPAVLVNKVQVQQPSPIIVTGGTSLGNQPLSVPVNGNQSIMLTFPLRVGNSEIMLATPVNIAENQISGLKQNNRVPFNKNTRLVPTNTVAIPRTVNPKFSSVAVTPVIGQTNTLPVSLPPGHRKPVAINVNQSGNITSALNIKNTNLSGGTLKAVPVSTAGNPAVGQTIPFFVDANSGLILTGSAVPSKDNVSSRIGNATVVTVNGSVVSGNVAPVTLGGKLAFGNLAPVNGLYIGNNSPVALTSNANNKGTLSINNPTILTLNGGLGIGNSGSVRAPIANIASVSANRTLQMAQTPASTVVGSASQQNKTILIRQSGVSNQPNSVQQPAVVIQRLFKCSECDEKFHSLENLTSHQADHRQRDVPAAGHAAKSASKDSRGNEVLPGTGEDNAPTILYTTQGDDGSTVYVVTV